MHMRFAGGRWKDSHEQSPQASLKPRYGEWFGTLRSRVQLLHINPAVAGMYRWIARHILRALQ